MNSYSPDCQFVGIVFPCQRSVGLVGFVFLVTWLRSVTNCSELPVRHVCQQSVRRAISERVEQVLRNRV